MQKTKNSKDKELAGTEHTSPTKLPLYVLEALDLIQVRDISEDSDLSVHCFYTQDNKAIFGINVMEMADSFLVAGSIRLTLDAQKQIQMYQAYPTFINRVYKSALTNQTIALPVYKYHFFKYLRDVVMKDVPEYFTEARTKKLLDFIQENEDEFEHFSFTSKSNQTLAKKGIDGATPDAFMASQNSEKIH